jgi:flagellar basal-body rod protein FlgG
MRCGRYIAASGMLAERYKSDRSTVVEVDDLQTDFAPKPSRDTGEPLDFAILGEGYFGVRTEQGVRYTRTGQFTVSPQGLLVTASGDPVLGRGGRAVRVGDNGRVDPRALDVVRIEHPRKEGDNLVTGTPSGTAGTGQVRAGALEVSGSDAARSMVDMIASLRAFEAGQEMIHAIRDAVREVNRAGAVVAPDALPSPARAAA